MKRSSHIKEYGSITVQLRRKKVCRVETALVTWVIKLGIKNAFGKDIGADFTIHSNITV